MDRSMDPSPVPARRGVVDLRQYSLVPGTRDTLVALFDTHFVAGQEDAGMQVILQSRDLDDPDRFVWMRGFEDVGARAAACTAFYGGPVWREHREAANATMADSDDALLLRPVHVGPAYPIAGSARPVGPSTAVLAVTVRGSEQPITPDLEEHLVTQVAPALEAAGGSLVAVLVSEESPNTFPALPIRPDHVVVWVQRFADLAAYDEHLAALVASPRWVDDALPALERHTTAWQQLRLSPSAGSHLR